MDLEVLNDNGESEVGSYFVANYPPFSVWSRNDVTAAMEAVDSPAPRDAEGNTAPLGLYLHIPFCRKRCHFCYFRVYTGKNSSEIEEYLDALANESALIGGSTGGGSDAAAIVAVARATGRANDPAVRQTLARVVSRERVLGWMRDRVQTDLLAGRAPTLDGSVLKVLWSRDRAAKGEAAIALQGAAGMLAGDDAPRGGFWQTLLLNRFWASIGGGTDEIHRTMIGERALGLPAEPRVDRGVPSPP